ncbi:MAG: hypothetical protein R2716_11595 [Microthrixaceae bacterium]
MGVPAAIAPWHRRAGGPYARGDVLAAIHRSGEVVAEEPGEETVRVTARMSDHDAARFSEFEVAERVEGR